MTTRLDAAASALMEMLPPIRRARLWRLYAENGRRFLDLWQDGGRGVLGAKGEGLGRVAKAEIDLGRGAPMPSVWNRRLASGLHAWKPAYAACRSYLSEERALAAANAAIARISGDRTWSGEVPLELPFGEYLDIARAESRETPRIALAVLPCPAMLCPAVLLLREEPDPRDEALASDLVPPLAAATACRSLAEYARFAEAAPERRWRKADRRIAGLFERRGPWLLPRYPENRHGDVFRACLAAGILISPDYGRPSILPGDFDDGELAPISEMDFV